jgi:uncharacterized protein YlzI (FlbEa/FlbD family)
MSNINKKSTSDQMRVFLRRMRGGQYIVNEDKIPKIDPDMRKMLKITRKLNEEVNDKKPENKVTIYDQKIEEEKFLGYFRDLNINVKFIQLEVYDNLVFWGGTVDGIIQFVYKVTPDETTSGVEFNYLEDFTPDNPENDEIVNKIEEYYNSFYKYWQNNILQR